MKLINILENAHDDWVKKIAADNRIKKQSSIVKAPKKHVDLFKHFDSDRKPTTDELHGINDIIQNAVSNSVPDGDPIDSIAPAVKRKYGLNISQELLDKAIKIDYSTKSHKTYDQYIADMWDFYAETSEDKRPNPWK